jgi:hypothetical protein
MLFRLILWSIGLLLWIASRMSPRLRLQLARDLRMTVASKDGVVRTYIVTDRRFSSRPGRVDDAECTITFQTAAQGARIFLASDAIKQIVDGLAHREIEVQGEATTVLWFYEMVIAYAPWQKSTSVSMPNPYVLPDPTGKVADRITREPAVEALDPSWVGANAQREKLVLWQVGKGAPVPRKPVDFKHVVDAPADALEDGV